MKKRSTEDNVIEPTPSQRRHNSRQIPELLRYDRLSPNPLLESQPRSRQNIEVRRPRPRPESSRQEQNTRVTSASVRTQLLSPERTPEPFHRRQNRSTPSRRQN
jgi:hypothetical protein